MSLAFRFRIGRVALHSAPAAGHSPSDAVVAIHQNGDTWLNQDGTELVWAV